MQHLSFSSPSVCQQPSSWSHNRWKSYEFISGIRIRIPNSVPFSTCRVAWAI